MPAFSNGTGQGFNAQTLNVPHTVSGSDRYMAVWITQNVGIDSVTWMGTPLTRKVQFVTTSNNTEVWELVAPATGSGNVVVELAVSGGAFVAVTSYTDVHQSTPTRSPVLDDVESGTSHSFLVPSDTDELVVGVADGVHGGVVTNIVSGAGQTTRVQNDGNMNVLVDDEPGASPNVSLDYSWTGSGAVSFVAFSLQPPAAPTEPDAGVEGRPQFQGASFIAPAGSNRRLSWQHEHSGPENRLLLVGIYGGPNAPVSHPRPVTFQGSPLTFVAESGSLGVYFLAGGPGGSGMIETDLGRTVGVAAGAAISLSNVNIKNPIASSVLAEGSGTGPGNPTVTIPTLETFLAVDFAMASHFNRNFTTEQVGQVERIQEDYGEAFQFGSSGNILVSTRGALDASTVLSWNASSVSNWWVVGLAILPPQPGTIILGDQVVQEIRPQWWGARGTGGGNDGPALERVMAVSALRPNQPVTIPAGVYNIESNLTLDSTVQFAQGAILRPTSGVTISVDGPVDPSLFKSFDTSLGGAVAFTGPYTIASATIVSVPFLTALVVTGTASINEILLAGEDAIVPGSRITFKFNAAASLLSTLGTGTGTGNIAIVGGDFTASANDIITLVYVDGAWRA